MTTQQKEMYDSQAFLDAVELEQEAWRLALGPRSAYPITVCIKDEFCKYGKHHIDCPLFSDIS